MRSLFRDRADAGRRLAEELQAYAGRPDVVVLALPRGGVPVGYEVARALGVPLDVFVVRKLGVPGHEELAMGAIASGNVIIVEPSVVRHLGLDMDDINAAAQRESAELRRREALYREGAPPLEVQGKTVIVIDDGLATGSTMQAAIQALRKLNPARIVVAVPVASPEVCRLIGRIADEAHCLLQPEQMVAVGMWYQDFSQTNDDEVRNLLARAADESAAV